VRRGLFSRDDLRALGRFVLTSRSRRSCSTRSRGSASARSSILSYLAAYASAGTSIVLGAFAWERTRAAARRRTAPIVATGMGFPNLAFVGYPIIVPLLGDAGAVAVALSFVVDNLLILPLALALAGSGNGARRVAAARAGARARGARATRCHRDRRPVRGSAQPASRFPAGDAHDRPVRRGVDGGRAVRRRRVARGPRGARHGARRRRDRDGKLLVHRARRRRARDAPPLDPALRIACIACACMPMVSIYPILAQK
jgi:hypothetical protein